MVFLQVACLLFYKNKIAASIKKIKITDFKYIGIALIFIIITMVASAIILSYNGIGESANQEAINNYISDYGIITLLVVIILGPLVEEIVFRGIIYYLLRGKKGNLAENYCCKLYNLIDVCDLSLRHQISSSI